MKKLLGLPALFFLVLSVTAQEAKTIDLTVYGGYVFQDRVELEGFTGYAREGFQYGAGVEYFLESGVSVDLRYLRQNTRFPLYGPNGGKVNKENDQGVVSYILAGGNGYTPAGSQSNAFLYGGFAFGVGILDAKEGGSSTKFAWDAKVGLKIKTSSKLSFKAQATLQSISATFGSDFYYDAAGVIAVPDYATLFQFGLGGGICYNFN